MQVNFMIFPIFFDPSQRLGRGIGAGSDRPTHLTQRLAPLRKKEGFDRIATIFIVLVEKSWWRSLGEEVLVERIAIKPNPN